MAGSSDQPTRFLNPSSLFNASALSIFMPITIAVGSFFSSVSRPVIIITSGFAAMTCSALMGAHCSTRSAAILSPPAKSISEPHISLP